MVITMAGQLKELLFMIIFGFVLAFAYDLIRVSRRVVAQSLFYVSVEDVLYWLACSLLVFLAILRLNYGEIRFFYLLGIFIGAILYLTLISPFFLKISISVLGLILKVAKFFLTPFTITYGVLKKIFELFVNFFKKLLKKLLKCAKINIRIVTKQLRIIFRKN